MSINIDCVDFSNLDCPDTLQSTSEKIISAFEDLGFVYLRNHGIPQHVIERAQAASNAFFSLPLATKQRFVLPLEKGGPQGYVGANMEKLDVTKFSYELRESYDIISWNRELFPIEKIQDFLESLELLFEEQIKVANKILLCIEFGLGLPHGTLLSKHVHPNSAHNGTMLRLLHYPPIPEDMGEGATRLGSHVDYGTFTLLLQDQIGGLEVQNCAGNWIKADPIPGTILVNIGEFLPMWTSGQLKATPHRVLIPKEEIKKRCSRNSIVLFFHPESNTIVRPLCEEKNDKYPPILAGKHVEKRYAQTYTQ